MRLGAAGHVGKANVVFCDGHTESMTISMIKPIPVRLSPGADDGLICVWKIAGYRPSRRRHRIDWRYDGIANDQDNCPDTPNPDQADADDDGTGDACNSDDPDEDGILSADDNCPNTYNPQQEDADTNGTGDACEDWRWRGTRWRAARRRSKRLLTGILR